MKINKILIALLLIILTIGAVSASNNTTADDNTLQIEDETVIDSDTTQAKQENMISPETGTLNAHYVISVDENYLNGSKHESTFNTCLQYYEHIEGNLQNDTIIENTQNNMSENENYTPSTTETSVTNESETGDHEGLGLIIYSLNPIYPWNWADSDGDSGPGIDVYLYSYFVNHLPTGNTTIYLNNNEIAVCHGDFSYLIDEATLWQNYTQKGYYTVKATYSGDDYFKPINVTERFYISTYICDYNGGAVELRLPSDISGVLTIRANGKSIYTKRIDATYQSYMSYTSQDYRIALANLVKAGKYSIEVIFNANSEKYSFTESFNYSKYSPKNIKMNYGDSENIYLNLKSAFGKEVDKNHTVKIKIGKKTYSAKTDTNGCVKFKIPNTLTPGKYQITITYNSAKVNKELSVNHAISLKTVKVKKSAKKLVLQATLKKVNGKYLKNKKITFKFNGKTLKAKTNGKGVAKVTVKKAVLNKLKVGKKIAYTATFGKDTVKKTAKVKR